MPQKRNPERSEHLATLARLVRADAALALEGMTGEHERDGAAGRPMEALPRAVAASSARARLRARARRRPARRRHPHARNLDAQRGYVLAEPAMLALATRIGKHRAHELVHRAALAGPGTGLTLGTRWRPTRRSPPRSRAGGAGGAAAPERALGAARELVDAIVARGRAR